MPDRGPRIEEFRSGSLKPRNVDVMECFHDCARGARATERSDARPAHHATVLSFQNKQLRITSRRPRCAA
jgi:hypothetical protein